MRPQYDLEYAKSLVKLNELNEELEKKDRLIYTLEMILTGYRGVLGLEKIELPKKDVADESI